MAISAGRSGHSAAVVAASRVTMAAHVFAVVTIILLLVWTLHFRGGASLKSDNVDLIINAHPVIMFVGFIFASGEAIMAYNMLPGRKEVRKAVHSLLQLVAISMGALGLFAAFKYHKEIGITNVYTLHSWLGIITISLYALQWLFGFFFFFYPGAPQPTRAMAVPWHAFSGLAIFLMGICTAQTGFTQKMANPGTEARMINFTALFVLLFGFTVCFSAVLPRLAAQTSTMV